MEKFCVENDQNNATRQQDEPLAECPLFFQGGCSKNGGIVEEDGKRWMKKSKKIEEIFFLVVGDGLGTLVGVGIAPKK